jgi:hypothetical protein
MQAVIIGTVKMIAALVLLLAIARLPHDSSADDPFFAGQEWTLRDAYKVLIPYFVLLWLFTFLLQGQLRYGLLLI